MTADTDANFIDARGLRCPLPVLKARKAISALPAGAVLNIVATDPAAPLDFQHFCNSQGHELVDVRTEGEELHFTIRRGG
ncbi:MAG: hypothetical protein CMH67_05540 [Nisaea sp.]|jgi:tRNA 2-thiouridine synthesizing protein A|nr:hypothetical protein [Nisaea sp.]OUX96636.1 MAG: hypothetical protein CBB86_05660 [Candidatus Endolissoclinum sp. TMED26]|tara:strand:- start:424 stop:663 length:240 start_codon:yes stop_codon:yes gene_type:complete